MEKLPGAITDFASGRSGQCATVSIEGHTLRIQSSVPFALRACVKVEEGNRMWIGDVWGCEPEDAGFAIEIEASSALADVAGVERLASRFQRGITAKPALDVSEPAIGWRDVPKRVG